MALTIAIDGPVGAGKSTIAKRLADRLGILHLDTGAMYRALGLKALREGVDPHDAQAAEALCARTEIGVEYADGAQRTLLDGEDVTGAIRTSEVSAAASAVSKAPGVRRHMVALQQAFARTQSMVLDGRDIGTTVLPGATHKFFLSGDPQVRARRRHEENLRRGMQSSYEDVLRELVVRDRQDSERAADPMRVAEDAIVVVTTDMDEQEVLTAILSRIEAKRA